MDWDFKYYIFPFLAHSIGTLTGAYSASIFSKNSNIIFPLIVGLYFFFGGIFMITIVIML